MSLLYIFNCRFLSSDLFCFGKCWKTFRLEKIKWRHNCKGFSLPPPLSHTRTHTTWTFSWNKFIFRTFHNSYGHTWADAAVFIANFFMFGFGLECLFRGYVAGKKSKIFFDRHTFHNTNKNRRRLWLSSLHVFVGSTRISSFTSIRDVRNFLLDFTLTSLQ